jgi:hypothetical protein
LISKKKKKFRCSSFQEPPYGRRVAAFCFFVEALYGVWRDFFFWGELPVRGDDGKGLVLLGGDGE